MVNPSLGRDTKKYRESHTGYRQRNGKRHRPHSYQPTLRKTTHWKVQTKIGTPGVYPKEQWQAATTRHPNNRRPDSTTGRSYGTGTNLRDRLSTLLTWIPTGI